jgi:hypothetical protein
MDRRQAPATDQQQDPLARVDDAGEVTPLARGNPGQRAGLDGCIAGSDGQDHSPGVADPGEHVRLQR